MRKHPDYAKYAAKMRHRVQSGTDLDVDVRFIDMLVRRRARILDIGCGIGTAVGGLRARGHDAYGIDPSQTVLDVAWDLHDPQWFQQLGATEATVTQLERGGFPGAYHLVLMSGNVPSFIPSENFGTAFAGVKDILLPGGLLVLGTTRAFPCGPEDQDVVAATSGLVLEHRYADWHLGAFGPESPWSVSVFAVAGSRTITDAPDGIFVLGR